MSPPNIYRHFQACSMNNTAFLFPLSLHWFHKSDEKWRERDCIGPIKYSRQVRPEVFNTHNCVFLSGSLVYSASWRRMNIDSQKFCTILVVTLRQNMAIFVIDGKPNWSLWQWSFLLSTTKGAEMIKTW